MNQSGGWVLNRRRFLGAAFQGAAGAALAGGATTLAVREAQALFTDDSSPIARVNGASSTDFGGDNAARAHAILWDKEAYLADKGGVPAPSETVHAIVVGGGLSGLTAAYRLRSLGPLLLEQAPRFGGNAKGEKWEDISYAIGSAYINRPEKGSAPAKLIDELHLTREMRSMQSEDEATLMPNGKIISPFWEGVTDPARADEFRRVRTALQQIHDSRYPSIPHDAESDISQDELFALDRQSFISWARANLGPLHPHVEELFHEYCWDSMAGAPDELSAAQVLNFFTADLEGMAGFPGGNSRIAEALRRKLLSSRARIRSTCFVVDVAADSSGVNVCYEQPDGRLKTVRAGHCVISAPKFVARVLIRDLPADQDAAIQRMHYRAYVVANVLVKRRIPSPTYGVFQLREKLPVDPTTEMRERAFTSMVFGGWSAHDKPNRSTLTLYKAFPYEDGRRELYKPTAFGDMKSRFEAAIPSLLDTVGVSQADVAGLRLTRWGHALPLAAVGQVADGTFACAARTVRERIHFAHQDDWANPCFETAVGEAERAAAEVLKG